MILTAPNLRRPDDIYERLLAMHKGLTADQSLRVNAKLILLLINHVGDEQARLAIDLASAQRSEGCTKDQA